MGRRPPIARGPIIAQHWLASYSHLRCAGDIPSKQTCVPAAQNAARNVDDPIGPSGACRVRGEPRGRLSPRCQFIVPAHLRLLRIDPQGCAGCWVALVEHSGTIEIKRHHNPLDPVGQQVAANRNRCPVGLRRDVERRFAWTVITSGADWSGRLENFSRPICRDRPPEATGNAVIGRLASHPFFRCRRPSSSAICTALSAAPLRRLSETHHSDRPLSTVGSSRTRLT